jgi:biopolymer transport protein ExbD
VESFSLCFSLTNRNYQLKQIGMAALMDAPVIRGRRAGVRRMKKHSLKTDMTPMVDLGFLLIAFFVITTELSQPRIANLNMPHDGPPMPVEMSNSLTVLVDKENAFYYYHGEWEEALKTEAIIKTVIDGLNGIRRVIQEKQRQLDVKSPSGEGRKGLMLIIKASDRANYEDIMSILDEVLINDVKKYAIVKPGKEETGYLYTHGN